MVRSAATPRVSNHEAMRYATMIPHEWNVRLISARRGQRLRDLLKQADITDL
jgi:hypothetical protein